MKLTFGKFKNKPLSEVPVDYLQWLQAEVDQGEEFNFAVDKELKLRYFEGDLDLAFANNSVSADEDYYGPVYDSEG